LVKEKKNFWTGKKIGKKEDKARGIFANSRAYESINNATSSD
jgi:hypothetical protein